MFQKLIKCLPLDPEEVGRTWQGVGVGRFKRTPFFPLRVISTMFPSKKDQQKRFFSQDECDLVERLYDEDKKDLAELQRHFEILQNKFDAIMEERRLEAEMAAKKEEEHRQMTIAATMMQALWRGYQVRRTLRGKSKKGAKKNQKGK